MTNEHSGKLFEIVDSPWGHIERWRANALAIGAMGALTQVHQIVRNDAAELQEQTAKFDAKKAHVLRTVNKLLNFLSRVDALTTRVEQLEAKHRADEEQRQHFEEEPLELPPTLIDTCLRRRSGTKRIIHRAIYTRSRRRKNRPTCQSHHSKTLTVKVIYPKNSNLQ
jgi:hypothetical protein